MAFPVRLWLSVYQGKCPMGPSELWTKVLVTDFPPRAGDRIHISVSEEDPTEGGPAWYVRNHYWDFDGSYHCEMTHMVVDPTDDYRPNYGDHDPPYRRNWGGPPEPMLRRGGWQTWKEWRENQ